MRIAALITSFIIIICPALSWGITGVSFGAKIGWAEYTGDVLPSSGDVGNSILYGAVIEVATLPVLDFELHANYFTKDFRYTYMVGGVPVSTDMEFRDFNLLVMAKKNLVDLPASPFSLYVGGGVGWHLINTEVAQDMASGTIPPSQADDPVALFKNAAKMSTHGLAGIKLSLPVIPLVFFSETRYGVIYTREKLNAFQVEGGIMLRF